MAAQPPSGATPGAPAYGWSDLNQYGTWSYVGNCGYGWLPMAAVGWSPFTFGQWSMYPGSGYTWISYEPWGWLPYHYGAWQLDPTLGWAWCPTGAWGGGLGWIWSPAIVTWYQGPGWIGWAPLPIHPISGTGLHPPRHPVGLNAVSAHTFERGGAVTSRELMSVDASEGKPVQAPPLQTGLMASLPGRPVRLSSAQQAVINGSPVRAQSGFMDRIFRASPSSGQWMHRAPQSSFAAPPAEVRSAETNYWSGRAPSSPAFHSYSPSGARSGGGFSSGARSGSFSAGNRGGGSIGGGAMSAGGGGHAGGGASAGGGGGGHH